MSGAVLPLSRLVVLVVLACLLGAPPVAAAAMEADLAFQGRPRIQGPATWTSEHGILDLHAGDSIPPFRLELQAKEILVKTQTWDYRYTDIGIYSDRTSSDRAETETLFRGATLVIDQLRPGARIAMASDLWDLHAEFDNATLNAALDIWATADPEDNDHRERRDSGANTDGRDWGHTAHLEDQVVAEPAQVSFQATGSLAMTFYEGDMSVHTAGGTTSYTSGETQQAHDELLGETIETSRRQLIIVTFVDATAHGDWGGYSRLSATAPEIHLDGIVDLDSARGTVAVDGVSVRAHDDPVRAEGKMSLRPRIDPDAELLPFDPFTEEVAYYTGGRMNADGDTAVVTVASTLIRHPFSTDPGLLIAAGTGIGVLGLAYAIWRFGPFIFAPFYSRLQQSELLDNPTRAALFQLICNRPGLSARQLHEHSPVSWGTVIHHLSKLEQARLVTVRRSGRAKCYYEDHSRWDGYQEQLALLARPKTRAVADLVYRAPGREQSEIVARISLPQSTVSYHLLKLEQAGLVTKIRNGPAASYMPTPALRFLADRLTESSPPDDPEGAPAGDPQ